MKNIHYRNDFEVDVTLTLGSEPVGVPSYDFDLVFFTSCGGRRYTCSRRGDVWTNCKAGDGVVRCFLDNHGLWPGSLLCEFWAYTPNTDFADGDQRIVTPAPLGIELTEAASDDDAVTAEVAVDILAVIADANSAAGLANEAASDASAAAEDARDAAQEARDAASHTGAQVQSDWTESDDTKMSYIKHKPTLATVATTGNYSDLTDKPSIPAAQIQSDWNQTTATAKDYIKNKPTIPSAPGTLDTTATTAQSTSASEALSGSVTLHKVAKTGTYSDLIGTPTIPPAQVQSNWSESDTSSKAYIQNKPTIPDLSTYCPIIEDTRSSSVAAITGTAPFDTLEDGQRIVVHFKYRNEASPTLQLTLSGGTTTAAIPLYQNYNSGVGTLTVQAMPAGSYGEFVYDQTNSRWVLVGKDVNTTYSNTSQADINNSAQGSRLIEPALLRTNFYLKSEATPKRLYVDNSADASVQLAVTTYNDLGTLSTWKTITLPATYDRADEFVFRFTCNDASLTPTLPQGVVMADNFEWSEMAVGVVFQVSICDGIAAYLCLTPQNP